MERRNKKTRQVGNGEGSLYYSESLKKWIYQYYPRSLESKRQTMTQKKGESKKDFLVRVTKIKNSINEGTYIQKSRDTLLSIIEKHIEQKLIDNELSDASYKRKLESLSQLKKTCYNFLSMPVIKIVAEDIEEAKPRMSTEYSQSCIDKMWGLLKTGFQIAHARKKITFNILLDPTLSKPISQKEIKKVEALTPQEENKLIHLLNTEFKNHKYRDIVKLQLLTGMRIGEVLARSANDFDEKNNELNIWNTLTIDKDGKVIIGKHTKTYNKKTGIDSGKRLLKLNNFNPEIREIILKQMSSKMSNIHKLLFWDYEKNTFISHGEINSWLTRVNDKYHISKNTLSTHVLRHTYITKLRTSGVDMKIIQYLVGHVEGSSITDTIYTSVSNEFIEKELKKVL